jgi:hypothetical protein
MRGWLLHLSALPVPLVVGGKTVKEVTTVVKITVLYNESCSLVRFAALCCAVLLAIQKSPQSSSPLSARSPRCAPAGGGSR